MMRVVRLPRDFSSAMSDQEMHFLEHPVVADIAVIARELDVAVVRHFEGTVW